MALETALTSVDLMFTWRLIANVLVYFSVQNLGPSTFPDAFLFVFSGVHSGRLYRDVAQLRDSTGTYY